MPAFVYDACIPDRAGVAHAELPARAKRVEVIKPDLRAHCHTCCAALGSHHRSEDDGFFPSSCGRRLTRDHRGIALYPARTTHRSPQP